MKIGIIGGGMTGLTLAQQLSKKDYTMTIFEKDLQLGGLATYHDYGRGIWDRFYHVILPSDTYLIGYLKEIGLGDLIHWRKTLTGFYVDQQYYSMSNSLEFLRFPPLSLLEKIRLALTIMYCSRIKDWQRLEKITVEEWLVRTCGQNTFDKIWKPLLMAKLGESYQRVSAVFIWTYIKRMFSARDTSVQKEQFGYVSGGYKTVIGHLTKLILSAGNVIRKGVSVERIESHPEGGILVKYNGKLEHFDKVVFTCPVNVLQRTVSKDIVKVAYDGGIVEYLGVICMVLITRKPLIPYYVLNIADARIPFTGVIGVSNVVSLHETAERHITYLPKYILSDNPLLRKPDDEIKKLFFSGLHLMFPELKKEDIESVHINRAFKVQPLQVLNYSHIVPEVITKHDDFFVLNTSQFINDTLNNNSVIRHVKEFLKEYGAKLEQVSQYKRVSARDEIAV